MPHLLARTGPVEEHIPEQSRRERVASIVAILRCDGRAVGRCRARSAEMIPYSVRPAPGGCLVIHIALTAWNQPARPQCLEARVELFRGPAKIGIVPVAKAQDR